MLPQQVADHVLARPFRATGRGYGDKLLRGRKLRVEIGIDCIKDFSLGIDWLHLVRLPVVAFRIASPPIHSTVRFRDPWRHG
jgi:hypothetical protein